MKRHLKGFILIAAGAALLLVSLALRLLLPENGEIISAPLNLGAGACVGVGLVYLFRSR